MPWQVRHEGSPQARGGLRLQQIINGLADGAWEPTDEVKGPSDTVWRRMEDHPLLAEAVLDLQPPASVGHSDETHLDMNALIDVCMVLLIFFIITTTHATAVQKIIPLPGAIADTKKGTKSYSADQVKKYMIRVRADGSPGKAPSIRIQGRVVEAVGRDSKGIDVEKLRAALRPHVQREPVKTEMVLLARGISVGEAVAIQDAAKAAGIKRIHRLRADQ